MIVEQMFKRLRDRLNVKDDRSRMVVKNILASFVLKAGSIAISLLVVPATLGYLNEYEYGVWLTLSSVLLWINYFDIGLGHGLRNRLSEALAVNDLARARTYISTTFCLLTFIMLGLYSLYIIGQYWLDWEAILKVRDAAIDTDLDSLVLIVLGLFGLSFVLKFIGNVYYAKQLPIVNDLFGFLGNLFGLLFIYILRYFTSEGSLEYVAYVFSGVPVLIYLIAYPITFSWKYKMLAPSVKSIDFSYSKDLLQLGGQFFVIQIACLLVFSSANLFIIRFDGAEAVTSYNIAFKYFSVVMMAFTIIITPFWSATTEAFVKEDYDWIKRSIRSMFFVWVLFTVGTALMVVLANWIYGIWVNMDIPLSYSLLLAVYVTLSNWNNIFAYFINGIGRVRLQLYCSIAAGIVFVVLAWILGHLWGTVGICVAMCASLLFSAVLLPIQYYHIMTKSSKTFWIK